MRPKGQTHLILIGLILLGALLAYGSALQAPLFFDDKPNLNHNPLVQISGQQFDQWRTAALSVDAGPLRRPVSMVSFAANHAVAGHFSPVSLKAVNLAIHLLTAVLVYFLAISVFKAPTLPSRDQATLRLGALAAMAIWLLHPLHVSTVLYSVQRMAQLAALFTVLGLWLFLHYRLQWAERGASVGEILAAGLWLSLITAVATLSKENGALLPWLLAVVEVTLFRGQWRGARSRVLARVGWLLLGLPLLLMAMILIIRPEIFTSGYQLRDFDLVERLMTQARLLWHYLGWLLLPDITAMGFQHDDIPLSGGLLQPWTTLLALLAWVGLTAAALLLRRQYPMLLFALLVFAVGHVMESSVLALEMVFEHRNYLPSVGICLLIGWCLGSNRQWLGRLDARVPMGLAIGGLLTLLIIRCHTWSDDMLLARTNVVNHPDSARAQYMYSHALLKEFNELRADSHSAEQSRALMVAVRRHLLRMEEKTNEGVAAAAMLLYIDSNYFPGLPSPVDWFSVLENVFQHRVLQASDMAALTLALECAGTGACDVQSQRIDGLLDRLIRRNPNEVRLLLAKYQHLVNTEAPLTQRLVPLDRAATIAPGHASVQHYRIVERGRAGDVAGMYQVVGNWLAHDPDRRDLPLIKSMFEIPGQSP